MGELVIFPNKNPDKIFVPQSTEEVEDNMEQIQLYHISETIDSVLPLIFNTLTIAGFDLSNNDDIKNGALLVEALRSVLCQFYGIDHPLQEVAESLFKTEAEGMLTMNDKLHIEFKKNRMSET